MWHKCSYATSLSLGIKMNTCHLFIYVAEDSEEFLLKVFDAQRFGEQRCAMLATNSYKGFYLRVHCNDWAAFLSLSLSALSLWAGSGLCCPPPSQAAFVCICSTTALATLLFILSDSLHRGKVILLFETLQAVLDGMWNLEFKVLGSDFSSVHQTYDFEHVN